jgi:hypothetical protein
MVTHAQFTYATNNGTVTITTYKGTNDVVLIPSTIDGLWELAPAKRKDVFALTDLSPEWLALEPRFISHPMEKTC